MIITVTMNPALDKYAEMDSFMYGGLNRLSNITTKAGGKGINVSCSIQQLKGRSLATGIVGGSNGEAILTELDQLHLSNDMVRTKTNTRVNLKLIDQDKCLTELNEVMEEVEETAVLELQMKLSRLAKQNDVVVLSGSIPQNVSATIYKTLTVLLKAQGVQVIVDADGEVLKEAIQAQPTMIKPNKKELAAYLQIEESELDEIKIMEAGKKLTANGIALVVVSLGSEGAYFFSKNRIIQVKSLTDQVVSVVGAGDAMVAACAIALQHHYDLETLVRLAMSAAASTVMNESAYVRSYEDVCFYQQQVEFIEKE